MNLLEVQHLAAVVEAESHRRVEFRNLEGNDPFHSATFYDYDFHEFRTFKAPGGWTWYKKLRAQRLNKRAFGVCA